jgi:membrane protease YdiL (CAAX protease family)
MIASATFSKKTWQRTKWTQVLAILICIAPIYGMTILSHLSRDHPYTLDEILFYTCLIAIPALVVLLLLLRCLCGERFSDLNLKQAHWWQDLLGGIVLAVLTMGVMIFLDPILRQLMPGEAQNSLGDVFTGLASDPWRLALFLGPALVFGVAGFEELTRVFFLSRWWKIASGSAWRWLGVLISAVLFGLAHLYQGQAGMVNTALYGLIMAVVYLHFGRIWPLMISHYLHDALQIVLMVYLIQNGLY